jgi:hypothetical protein
VLEARSYELNQFTNNMANTFRNLDPAVTVCMSGLIRCYNLLTTSIFCNTNPIPRQNSRLIVSAWKELPRHVTERGSERYTFTCRGERGSQGWWLTHACSHISMCLIILPSRDEKALISTILNTERAINLYLKTLTIYHAVKYGSKSLSLMH